MHLADEYENYLGAVSPPIYQNSLHVFSTVENMHNYSKDTKNKYLYGRLSNPTIHILEQKLAALENGEMALCFGSGMAAISSAIMSSVKSGDHIIAIRNIYSPSKVFLTDYLARLDITVTLVKGEIDEILEAIRPNTSLIYLESPTSAIYKIQDLSAISQIAKSKGIRTVIDNSWCTPIYQNPLDFGIDLVVHTMSKYIRGHSDIIGGVVIGSNEIISSIVSNERELFGGILHPMEGWIALRGLRTLPIRMKQHQENAMKVAQYLENHPKIKRVYYPGLKSFPQYELSKKQMTGYSGLLSFVIDGDEADTIKVINTTRLFNIGPGWGGFESLIVPVSLKMEDQTRKYYDLPASLVRLSVGLEDCDSLINDLKQALAII